MDVRLEHKASWTPKDWCFWTAVLEEIKLVNPKGNQSWIFIEKTDAEAEALILWPPDAKNWLIGKDPDAAKDWRQEEKGVTEDERLDGITDLMDMSLSRIQEMVKNSEAWCAAVQGIAKSQTEGLNNKGASWKKKRLITLEDLKSSTSLGLNLDLSNQN